MNASAATFAQTGLGCQGANTLSALALEPTVAPDELLVAVELLRDLLTASITTGEVAPEARSCFSISIPLDERRAAIALWSLRR